MAVAKKVFYEVNYVQIPNETAQAPQETISLQALGLITNMWSYPDTWEVHKTELYKRFVKNKETSVKSAWKELVEFNYIIEFKYRTGKKWDYVYYYRPMPFTEAEKEKILKVAAEEYGEIWGLDFQDLKMKSSKCRPQNQEIINNIYKQEFIKTKNIKEEEEEEKVSSIHLENSVKEYLTNELKYDSTLLSDIAEQMAAFDIVSFTNDEMADQHNFMVEQDEIERITEWAFYFVNGIAMRRKNPKNKVAAGSKKKKTGSIKKAIREEMVPDWLYKEEVAAKPKEESNAPIISEERKREIWAKVKKMNGIEPNSQYDSSVENLSDERNQL